VAALDHFKQNGGLLIYLRQEGRGIGLVEKLRAYNLQDEGLDTFEANVARGHAEDAREYDAAVAILRQLGVESVGLLTNNPHKVKALENAGVEVDRIAVAVGAHQDNAAYLKAKADIAGHWL
jgi:3,4-dihydroxy 2-butanone 4-phosphate synthase/GTP cyclohydrolase II